MSRDLLCGSCRRLHKRCAHPEIRGKIHYGDWIYGKSVGFLQANDVMGAREHYWVRAKGGRRKRFKTIRQHVDVWVATLDEEKVFHKAHKGKAIELYKVEVKEHD